MAFDVGKLTAILSMKKKISIQISNYFLFRIYRIKINDMWEKRLILLACPWGYKAWWK